MNLQGEYVHVKEDRIEEKPSFQWGALASQAPDFSWDKVAQAQLDAGSSGSLKKQILFDNSFRGLPFRERRRDEKKEIAMKRHCAPVPEKLLYNLMAIDTQDDCFYYTVRGYDGNNNSYLLDCGKIPTIEQLAKLWDTAFLGQKCIMGIIDSGGHRTREVGEFVSGKGGMYMYKGRGQLAYRRWEASKDTKKLILCNPNIYKAELLYTMYGLENKGKHYWFLPPEIDSTYMQQMLDHKPDNGKRDGNKYVNWISTGNDHLFDCEKELLMLNEMYIHFARLQGGKKQISGKK
jgi:hypothetical protein